MTTSRVIAEAIRGHAEDIREGRAGAYNAVALERLAAEVEAMNARDLIGVAEASQWR
jgi:hypothetical protein